MNKTALAIALAAALSGNASAMNFELEGDWKASWVTTLYAGATWRAENRDPKLFSKNDGAFIGLNNGLGGSNTDGGNLNYAKGDITSALFKFISDVEVKRGGEGAFVRVKGWYDYAQNKHNVPFGNQANGYAQDRPLSDQGFEPFLRFQGFELLDAYAWYTWNFDERQLQVRLGNQVLNWGESIFFQGLNQINPIDLTALRRPGTELKEVYLPVPMAYGNFGLGKGVSVEAFYQLKWQQTSVDGCGTYWAVAETSISRSPSPCIAVSLPGLTSNPGAVTPGPPFALAPGGQYLGYFPLQDGRAAKNSGQGGMTLRWLVDSLDTEFGFYAMNIHSRTPIISAQSGNSFGPFLNAPAVGTLLGLKPGYGFWEYPENIQLYGATATTNLAGWSLAGEVSYSPNYPAQVNGNDLLAAVLQGVGPAAARALAVKDQVGAYIPGYDRLHKTQLDLNAVKVFPDVLGSVQAQLIADVAMQWVNVPDKSTGVRYGRGFIFGAGAAPSYGTTADCLPSNPQPDGCKNDGYATSFAWGIRARGQLEYPNLFESGFTFYPSVFVGYDVRGYSIDTQLNEGRVPVGVGLKFSYAKQHVIDINYNSFANSAKYDQFRDHDFIGVSYSYTF